MLYWRYMLRYHYKGLNPDELSTEEWANAIAYLEIIRKEEAGKET